MRKPRYSEEFKRDAVNQVLYGGRLQVEVAEALNVSTSAINHWVKKFQETITEEQQEEISEIERLRKQNRRLQMENDILKKAAAIFSRENR